MAKTLQQIREIYELRALRDLDGMFRLTATPHHGYGQSFWFSDYRYSTRKDATGSPDLLDWRGPIC